MIQLASYSIKKLLTIPGAFIINKISAYNPNAKAARKPKKDSEPSFDQVS
jgi:hypothetical protein